MSISDNLIGSPDTETNAWLETYTGRRYYVASPRVEDITIFDIAHALAFRSRYNGHVGRYYSIAEHCVALAMCARHLKMSPEIQMHMLMHDGGEAYLPDVPRPIKAFLPDLRRLEKLNDKTMRLWAGLSDEVPAVVKEWDSRIIRDERRQMLMPSANTWTTDSLVPLDLDLQSWAPEVAELQFLRAYQQIGFEYFKENVLVAYNAGEFNAGHSDKPNFQALDIRMIDFRGNCAMYATETGYLRFQHGNFNLDHRA